VNAYLAMRAVLLLVLNGRFLGGAHDGDTIAKHVQTIAVPGLVQDQGSFSGMDKCSS
jgi:hypothetical protein